MRLGGGAKEAGSRSEEMGTGSRYDCAADSRPRTEPYVWTFSEIRERKEEKRKKKW